MLMPILHGTLGAWLGSLSGLSVGGCTVLATMAASASYIAAPPAVRMTLPEANPDVLSDGRSGHHLPVQPAGWHSHLLRDLRNGCVLDDCTRNLNRNPK
jgi:hypothetical protein